MLSITSCLLFLLEFLEGVCVCGWWGGGGGGGGGQQTDDDIFSDFSQKIGFNISCKLPWRQFA